ncbi:MAG: bifunctional hydroxymethylpyrimidine kinase/phosphomethylpyrimidine kinase [Prevotella sp.]|nr:bifunctional hydroxymethylpyrimidine kinase/phosphomethylpyrimidine kinase [Prevotella sp.]
MRYICALTIAGSDSCGGAGVQADIKTMSALGVYAASAITSVTVQNTLGVQAIQAIQPEIVAGQIQAVMDDIKPTAIKVGMVNDQATILAIADTLRQYSPQKLVVDPVMVSTSGSMLMQKDALGTFCSRLLPMATLLTPNIPEAEVLSNLSIRSIDDMDAAGRSILALGCKAVLIKGGHLEGRKVDKLYLPNGEVCSFVHEAIATRNTHGTGCTLSSAIAAFMARGLALADAVAQAKTYLSQALEAGKDVHIGEGHGPVNHLFNPEKQIIL